MKKLLLLAIFCLNIPSCHATRFYVNTSATGSNNGLTWTNAFTNLQSALSTVIFGDEIWVAAGTYYPTATTTRTISFVLKDGVNLYGGFNGTETLLSQRDIASAPTSLSGDIGALGEYLDNSYNVVRANNLSSTISLDGFRILNGYAASPVNGGGLYISQSTSGNLIVRNCLFFSNRASNYGGGICMYNSRLTIDNCDFRNNIGQQAGGAIYGTTSGAENNLYITNSRFISNTGDLGACIGGNGSYHDIIIDRCTFTQNVGGNYVIQIDDFTNARIYNSLLVGNSLAEGYASVLGVDEAVNVTTDDFMMANTTIANNINTYQFGPSNDIVYLGKSYYKIYNSIIYGNTPYQGRQLTAGRVIRNSIIQAGYAGGINVLNADPLFVNPNTNYSQAFDGSLYNYRLQSGSPAQNAGDNNYVYPTYNLDLDNTNRIDQNIVDMGSYESTFLATTGYNQQLIRFQYINSQKKIYLLNFELTNKEKVEIFSLNGSLVRQYLSPSNEIEINLMPGLYIVKVRGDSFKISVY